MLRFDEKICGTNWNVPFWYKKFLEHIETFRFDIKNQKHIETFQFEKNINKTLKRSELQIRYLTNFAKKNHIHRIFAKIFARIHTWRRCLRNFRKNDHTRGFSSTFLRNCLKNLTISWKCKKTFLYDLFQLMNCCSIFYDDSEKIFVK